MNNASNQALTPTQAAIGSAVLGAIAGGFAYLETASFVLALLGALVVAVAFARWLPKQPVNPKGDTRGKPLPRASLATIGLLLAIGVGLAVWLSDWVIAAATAGSSAFWLLLILRSQRR